MKLAMLLVSLLFLATTPMIEAKKAKGCTEFTGKKCKKYDTVSCQDVCKKKKCKKKCTKCVEQCTGKKKKKKCTKECKDAAKPKKCTKKCMKKEQ